MPPWQRRTIALAERRRGGSILQTCDVAAKLLLAVREAAGITIPARVLVVESAQRSLVEHIRITELRLAMRERASGIWATTFGKSLAEPGLPQIWLPFKLIHRMSKNTRRFVWAAVALQVPHAHSCLPQLRQNALGIAIALLHCPLVLVANFAWRLRHRDLRGNVKSTLTDRPR